MSLTKRASHPGCSQNFTAVLWISSSRKGDTSQHITTSQQFWQSASRSFEYDIFRPTRAFDTKLHQHIENNLNKYVLIFIFYRMASFISKQYLFEGRNIRLKNVAVAMTSHHGDEESRCNLVQLYLNIHTIRSNCRDFIRSTRDKIFPLVNALAKWCVIHKTMGDADFSSWSQGIKA